MEDRLPYDEVVRGEAIPDPPEDPLDPPPESAIRTDFAPMLGELSLWLGAYAMASGQLDIGPLALHDVPAMVPCVLDIPAGPEGPRATGSGMLPIHARMPNLAPAEGNVEAGRSASLLIARGPEAFPFFGPISLLFQAQSHSLAGRSRQAVIDTGTAIESLVTVSIREAMRVRGRSEDDVGELFEAKWKTVYNRSLLETLGVPVGAGGAAHSKWWADADKLRNDVVHRGMAVAAEDAERAVARSWDFSSGSASD